MNLFRRKLPLMLTRQNVISAKCLRVIVNEKPLNFEKTTSSVLSVLL